MMVSWLDYLTKETILQRINMEAEMVITQTRNLEYINWIMKNNSGFQLLQRMLQGKLYGKRGVQIFAPGSRWHTTIYYGDGQ